jgi:hypothetical protein
MSETSLFESAQALFCSIADGLELTPKQIQAKVLNIKTYPTFEEFQKKHKKLIVSAFKQANVTESPKAIYKFLSKSNSWYISSIQIANKVISDLHTEVDKDFNLKKKGYESKAFSWFRGDKEVAGGIEALFKIANKGASTATAMWGDGNTSSSFFGYANVNKWNPADIYYANATAKQAIKTELTRATGLKTAYGFSGGNLGKGSIKKPEAGDGLNVFIARLVDGGDLLPLSLKKQTGSVMLRPVNFVKNDKSKLIDSIKLPEEKVFSDWKPFKRLGDDDRMTSWHLFKEGQNTETRDIKIYFKSDIVGEGEIKIRHDPSGSGRFVAECKYGGAKAKAGSIASWKQFALIWQKVDPVPASEFRQKYSEGDLEFDKIKAKLTTKEKDKLRGKGKPINAKIYKARGTSAYDHYMAIASGENITNKINPIIKKWFTSATEDKKVLFVRLLFQVMTSRSPLSSRFVIAK